ncbi:hypothetical protein [Paenibacillus endoradicis]|uniref:hypothetical protein n=1 Tax=Paenibacillus endoradicis TaxID=2972487 RepID=UPI0021591A33|nr:hypothetical protein [Paenibacillus endoradicis]MCR8657629.1 hypothetical protein [Paenibacillus endoradicis]
MYKKVENELELAMFNGIWTTVWREKGYELEFSEDILEQNLIFTEKGEFVGTAELKPYIHDEQHKINVIAPFHKHPLIYGSKGRVGEIDKIALLKTYRVSGEYISPILSSIVHSSAKFQLRYLVSLMEPIFMRALKVTYKVPLQQLGGKMFYKGDYVIPVIFDIGYMIDHPEEFTWNINSKMMQPSY